MSYITKYVKPPSELELLIFPELTNLKRDESELNFERLTTFDYTYNIPPFKYFKPDELPNKKRNIFIKKKRNLKKKMKRFLYYFFIRFLLNCSLISNQNTLVLIISTFKDLDLEKAISEVRNPLKVKPLSLQKHIVNLKNLEKLLNKFLSFLTLSIHFNQPRLFINKQYITKYQGHFNKIKENSIAKHLSLISEWSSNDQFRHITKYEDFKIDYYKTKLAALLKDKLLFKHIIQGFFFTTPQEKLKKQYIFHKKLRKLFLFAKHKSLFKLITYVIKKLTLRRKLLWLNIQINMVRHYTKYYLIGQDYRIYRPKVARTYISQTKKYYKRIKQKKKLNTKYIKCVEFYYNRKHMQKLRDVLNKIYQINLHLRYFINRFSTKLIKKKKKYYDSKFVVPIKSQVLSYNELLDKLSNSNIKAKIKIFDIILFNYKHHLEKRFLKNIRNKRNITLKYFVRILEKEKYYAAHRKRKFNPRLRKWLMKYVNDQLSDEFREYFSRPRVILEKREEDIVRTYPYLPRKPLIFQRDLNTKNFKRRKFRKYTIIRLTKPWIVLQSQFLSHKGSNYLSKNLLLTKLKHRLAIPERVERIHRSCNNYYKNFLKNPSYQSFLNLISKLKIFYLINPKFKKNYKFLFIYLLTAFVSPLFSGITEEREYANELHKFLTHQLVRIRPHRWYDFTNLISDLRTGYIKPTPRNYRRIKKFFKKTKNIIKKRPKYDVIRLMHLKSLRKLTVRIRSKIAVASGLLSLFKYNLVATNYCSPIYMKKHFQNKGYHYLFQPDINKKAKAKYKYYISTLKKTFGYSTIFHTNARLDSYTPFNLFLQNPEEIQGLDAVAKYKEIMNTKKYN